MKVRNFKAGQGSVHRPLSSELWEKLIFYNLSKRPRCQYGGNHRRRHSIRVVEPSTRPEFTAVFDRNKVNQTNLLNIQVTTSSQPLETHDSQLKAKVVHLNMHSLRNSVHLIHSVNQRWIVILT